MKEITGHVSDAAHKYQSTSDAQRMSLSEIIQGDVPMSLNCHKQNSMEVVEVPKEVPNEVKYALPKLVLPKVVKSDSKV